MYGFVVVCLAFGIMVVLGMARLGRTRRSPQLSDILRSGLLATKRFRPAFKHNLLQIEEALPYLRLKSPGGKRFQAISQAEAATAGELQIRLEQLEKRCALLTQQNADLSRALSQTDALLANIRDIASATIRSAGLELAPERCSAGLSGESQSTANTDPEEQPTLAHLALKP